MQYLKIWLNFDEIIAPLTDAEVGRLFRMMMQYAGTGIAPTEFAGNERFVWAAAKQAIDAAAAKSETLRQNGMRGGRPSSGEKQKEANESKQKQTKANDKDKAKEAEERFNRFWAAYPRKVGKENARKAFQKVGPDDNLLNTMLAAIAKQKESEQWTKDGGQFIPHPATWLNGKRWEDEVTVRSGGRVLPAQDFQQRDYSGVDNELMQNLQNDMKKFKQGAS